jgi:transcriptional regulator with XRE-family HTH domain
MPVEDLLPRFPKLREWEAGEAKPTFRQLEDFADATAAPFGYFFLPEPPDEPLPIPDFRTLGDKPVRRPTPNLLDTIFDLQRRQDWLREERIVAHAKARRCPARARSLGNPLRRGRSHSACRREFGSGDTGDTQRHHGLRGRRSTTLKKLAGAAGVEPANGGIKIRCLTTWLRPTREHMVR